MGEPKMRVQIKTTGMHIITTAEIIFHGIHKGAGSLSSCSTTLMFSGTLEIFTRRIYYVR